MTKLCITCKYFDDYFTRKCDNPSSQNFGEKMAPQCVCKDWAAAKKAKEKEPEK